MDFWQKARIFAQEATKELSKEAAKRSQDLTNIVSETATKSKQIAAEASNTIGTAKLSDIVSKTFSGGIKEVAAETPSEEELDRYGVSEELREFVKEITLSTFRDFPLEDDSEMSEVITVSNVRQDLTEWQAKHANLVFSTVKEISKLRYELCPRVMKERKFWRIYFILMNSHVAPYEKRYMEEANKTSAENAKDERVDETPKNEIILKQEENKSQQQNKKSTPSSADQDLDIFLLGEDSDEGPDDDGDDAGFGDDLDKTVDSSDDEKEKI